MAKSCIYMGVWSLQIGLFKAESAPISPHGFKITILARMGLRFPENPIPYLNDINEAIDFIYTS